MPLTTLNDIKNWYKTGLKPTQAQFWSWLDSFVHKTDAITQDKVVGLQAALATIPLTVTKIVETEDTFDLTADTKLESIYIKVAETGTVKIGSTEGGGEYFDAAVELGSPVNIDLGIVHDSEITFYLTGNFTCKIYTR